MCSTVLQNCPVFQNYLCSSIHIQLVPLSMNFKIHKIKNRQNSILCTPYSTWDHLLFFASHPADQPSFLSYSERSCSLVCNRNSTTNPLPTTLLLQAEMSSPAQRRFSGRWTPEEERYAQFLMKEFRDGSLAIAEGTSLRVYLAEELKCSPKR